MQIHYVYATPELIHKYQEVSGSNASDFVNFDDSTYALFAVDGVQPIALIVAKQRYLNEPLQMEQEAFITIIEVLPDYQRQGIGSTLVDSVALWAKAKGMMQVRAWSEEIRYEVLMLWRKLGFTFSHIDFERDGEKRYGFYVTKHL
jgi:GNAT superfamily N-acetyltransferase